ncbi:hypothetical protein [Rhizobium sp. L43]|uniref:hypothetical protein n=1 Tax=Rhizobium sp. L43 TaxID=2035452 RepID=UPI0015CF78D1|nr:hypothetical protein [Rhizobium sp. L43]
MAFQARHDRYAAGSRPATIEGWFALDVHSMDGRKIKPDILTKITSIPGNSHTASKIPTDLLTRRFTLPPSFDSIEIISHFE